MHRFDAIKNQRSLDHFLTGSTTIFNPDPDASISQCIVSPAFNPIVSTTKAGIVVRKDPDPVLAGVNVVSFLDILSPNSQKGSVLYNVTYNKGSHVTHKYIYPLSNIGNSKGNRWITMTVHNPRQLKALAILSSGIDAIKRVNDRKWLVKSQHTDSYYEVQRKSHTPWECSCPNWKEFRQPCKHIYAVTFSAQLRLDVEKDFKPSETSLDIVEIVECPKCKGNSIVKNGSRKCHKGTNQRYLCQDCGHRFVKDLELSRLKASTEVVCVCMDLYFKGNSLAKIKHHLKMFYQVEVSRPTIMRWVHKFSEILSNYSDRQTPPNIGDLWNSDEMMVNIREAGKDRNLEWIWNLMDSSTRFLLASTISKERRVEDAAKVLNQGKERAGKKPAAFITDGNKTYPEANRKVFYTNTAPTIHFRTPAHRKYFLNQNIERLNGTIRERVKVMRGLDGEDTGQVILDGERFYYNYIRPHMALDGRTPADMAGLQMPEGSLWSIYIKKALKT